MLMKCPRKQLSFLFPYIHQHLRSISWRGGGVQGLGHRSETPSNKREATRLWGRTPALPGAACDLVGIAFTWGPIQGKKDQDIRLNVSLMRRSHAAFGTA